MTTEQLSKLDVLLGDLGLAWIPGAEAVAAEEDRVSSGIMHCLRRVCTLVFKYEYYRVCLITINISTVFSSQALPAHTIYILIFPIPSLCDNGGENLNLVCSPSTLIVFLFL